MPTIEGGCLCGSVRYTSDAEPQAIINCYCRTCRKSSGSTHSFNVIMPEGSVTVTGDTVGVYEDHSGASGQAFNRYFCTRCGSPFLARGPAYPGLEALKADTLDDAEWAEPQFHIWCAEKLGWLALPEDAPQVPGNPDL